MQKLTLKEAASIIDDVEKGLSKSQKEKFRSAICAIIDYALEKREEGVKSNVAEDP